MIRKADPDCCALKLPMIIDTFWHCKDQKELWKLLLGWSCLFSSRSAATFVRAPLLKCSPHSYNNSQDISHLFSVTVNFKLTLDVWFFTQLLIFFISASRNVSEHQNVPPNYQDTVSCNCRDKSSSHAAVVQPANIPPAPVFLSHEIVYE